MPWKSSEAAFKSRRRLCLQFRWRQTSSRTPRLPLNLRHSSAMCLPEHRKQRTRLNDRSINRVGVSGLDINHQLLNRLQRSRQSFCFPLPFGGPRSILSIWTPSPQPLPSPQDHTYKHCGQSAHGRTSEHLYKVLRLLCDLEGMSIGLGHEQTVNTGLGLSMAGIHSRNYSSRETFRPPPCR